MPPAPIIMFVYNRPWHTQRTIEALQKNYLSGKSDLFIYSDGPKGEYDTENIEKVRTYLRSLTGFRSITIIERKRNFGLAQSVIFGVSEIINKYGRIIVMEDDLISSPGFLNFMNDGLEFYEKNPEIFCITGYNFPPSILKIPKDYPYDVYISPRNGSWGWATWKDRWLRADWAVSDYRQFFLDKHKQDAFNFGGEDLSATLQAQQEGKIDSWAIRWCYTMFRNTGYCIYPVHSFIDNIGCDGTGVHSGTDRLHRMKNYVLNKGGKIQFPKKIAINDNVMKRFQSVFRKKNILVKMYEHCTGIPVKFFHR